MFRKTILAMAAVMSLSVVANAATISVEPQPGPLFIKVTVVDTSGLFNYVRTEVPDEGPWHVMNEFSDSFWTDASALFIGTSSGWGTTYPVEWHNHYLGDGSRADLLIVTGDWQEGVEGGTINYLTHYENGHNVLHTGVPMRSVPGGAVPEPGTLGLIGVGLVCLGWFSRR